ncbi:MAG: NUDIX hydrolase [Acidimicrobiales bacterium]|nr:NUDIX hydrolase [Acidimicrobiales bacterium]
MEETLIPAATVVLGRDGVDGLEVLMLKRNSKIAFGGAWVFPGGRVDDDDTGDDDISRARSAAVREAAEETGLDIASQRMEPWSYWVPPPLKSMVVEGKIRRFSTWFFVGHAPPDEVRIDMGEIHDHKWLAPGAALELHRAGEIELIPPTWITLFQLSRFDTIDHALDGRVESDPPRFITVPIPGNPVLLVWEGDVAYRDKTKLHDPGGRNRLVMADGNWAYERR